ADRRAGERQREHRLATVPIRQLAEHRRREELHHRINGDEESEEHVPRTHAHRAAQDVVRRVRVAEQLREDRTQDADTERVDEDGEENDPDRMPLHISRGIIPHAARPPCRFALNKSEASSVPPICWRRAPPAPTDGLIRPPFARKKTRPFARRWRASATSAS